MPILNWSVLGLAIIVLGCGGTGGATGGRTGSGSGGIAGGGTGGSADFTNRYTTDGI